MLATLNRDEVDKEESLSLSCDVVGHILSRRSTDTDLECAVPSIAHVNCSRHIAPATVGYAIRFNIVTSTGTEMLTVKRTRHS